MDRKSQLAFNKKKKKKVQQQGIDLFCLKEKKEKKRKDLSAIGWRQALESYDPLRAKYSPGRPDVYRGIKKKKKQTVFRSSLCCSTHNNNTAQFDPPGSARKGSENKKWESNEIREEEEGEEDLSVLLSSLVFFQERKKTKNGEIKKKGRAEVEMATSVILCVCRKIDSCCLLIDGRPPSRPI